MISLSCLLLGKITLSAHHCRGRQECRPKSKSSQARQPSSCCPFVPQIPAVCTMGCLPILYLKSFASSPWSTGMAGTSFDAGEMHTIWLPKTWPSTSVRFPNTQVIPVDRSGASLTSKLSYNKTKQNQKAERERDHHLSLHKREGKGKVGHLFSFFLKEMRSKDAGCSSTVSQITS